MIIEIQIDCETKSELLNHLYVIRQQIKKELEEDDERKEVLLSDSNCYGSHCVKIKPMEYPS